MHLSVLVTAEVPFPACSLGDYNLEFREPGQDLAAGCDEHPFEDEVDTVDAQGSLGDC